MHTLGNNVFPPGISFSLADYRDDAYLLPEGKKTAAVVFLRKSNKALIKNSSAGNQEELVGIIATEDVHGDILISKGCLKIMIADHVECLEFSAVVKTTDAVT